MAIKLRDYQEKIVTEVIDNFDSKQRQMIVVPTGGGKTVIFSSIVQRTGLKTLVIAHTIELVEQATQTLKKIAPNVFWRVTTIQASSFDSNFKDILKAKYELIIIDECHRIGAPSYHRIIDNNPQAKILGVTATPFRHDGQKLSDILNLPVASISMIEMINQGYLCDFKGYRVKTNTSLKGISRKQGDFATSRLEAVINVKNRNELIVKEYLKIAPGEKALCFAVNIKHALELEKEFKLAGISAACIHGNLGVQNSLSHGGQSGNISKNQRRKLIKDFKDGRIQVMVNCQILTEGFDEPSIKCLIMARPTMSKLLYMQMIGRGSRTFPGKEFCKVIEFTDNQYDVCQLEDLIDARVKAYKMEKEESLSDFERRMKQLQPETDNTVIEEMVVVSKTPIQERLATPWQLKFLKSINAKFTEPITELMANKLIAEVANA